MDDIRKRIAEKIDVLAQDCLDSTKDILQELLSNTVKSYTGGDVSKPPCLPKTPSAARTRRGLCQRKHCTENDSLGTDKCLGTVTKNNRGLFDDSDASPILGKLGDKSVRRLRSRSIIVEEEQIEEKEKATYNRGPADSDASPRLDKLGDKSVRRLRSRSIIVEEEQIEEKEKATYNRGPADDSNASPRLDKLGDKSVRRLCSRSAVVEAEQIEEKEKKTSSRGPVDDGNASPRLDKLGDTSVKRLRSRSAVVEAEQSEEEKTPQLSKKNDASGSVTDCMVVVDCVMAESDLTPVDNVHRPTGSGRSDTKMEEASDMKMDTTSPDSNDVSKATPDTVVRKPPQISTPTLEVTPSTFMKTPSTLVKPPTDNCCPGLRTTEKDSYSTMTQVHATVTKPSSTLAKRLPDTATSSSAETPLQPTFSAFSPARLKNTAPTVPSGLLMSTNHKPGQQFTKKTVWTQKQLQAKERLLEKERKDKERLLLLEKKKEEERLLKKRKNEEHMRKVMERNEALRLQQEAEIKRARLCRQPLHTTQQVAAKPAGKLRGGAPVSKEEKIYCEKENIADTTFVKPQWSQDPVESDEELCREMEHNTLIKYGTEKYQNRLEEEMKMINQEKERFCSIGNIGKQLPLMPENISVTTNGNGVPKPQPVSQLAYLTQLSPASNCNELDNYGIDDLDSGDSTDEDDHPRKCIPKWAKGEDLCKAIKVQEERPLNSSMALFKFDPDEEVSLNKIFRQKKPRFFKRTSSAVWCSPPMK